jgi:putative ABC transport system ATP-binding protein
MIFSHSSLEREYLVEVNGLSKTFSGPPPLTALHPCNFVIRRGEYIAIEGASGSGKTTLLSLLGLLDYPSSGNYLLNGIDVAKLDDRQQTNFRAFQIGFVFQAFHLLPHRTVIANVELGLLYQGVSSSQRRVRALNVIEQVGLTNRGSALCANLSGGEKQRVAIARTLIRQPSLILCDEPTGNLDTANSQQILQLLDSLHQLGLTIVVITHDAIVAKMAQRLLTLSDGVLTEPGAKYATQD